MVTTEKQECPYCGKKFKNLKAHIKRMHPDAGDVSAGGSINELEAKLAKKFLAKVNKEYDEDIKELSKDELEKLKEERRKKAKKEKPTFEKKVVVDFWLTDLHDAEMGIFQKERLMAKNRQFSKNLEIIGAVKEEGKGDGFFAYNAASWDDIPLKDLPKKRLIIKWFNAESVGWLGTLEEMVVPTITSSIGANDFLPSFKIILPRYKYVVNLNKEHTRLPKTGEIFTFALKFEKEKEWKIFTFDEKRFTIGSDWEIVDKDERIVGKIDEKKLNIGGKFDVYFYDEKLYKNPHFYRVVILFTMMLKFKDEIKKDIEKITDYIKAGKIKLTPSADEERFLMNPRSIRR